MNPEALSCAQLCDLLDDSWEIITDSADASLFIRFIYDRHQAQKNKQVWSSPKVYTFTQWIHELWQEHRKEHSQTLLEAEREQLLICRILQSQKNDPSVCMQVARSMHHSWRNLKRYYPDTQLEDAGFGELFIRSINRFTQDCLHNNWLNEDELCTLLAQNPKLLRKRKVAALYSSTKGLQRKRIFDRAHLLKCIRLRSAAGQPSSRHHHVFERTSDQFEGVARWFHTQRAHQPNGLLLALCANPASQSLKLDRALRNQLLDVNDTILVMAPAPIKDEPTTLFFNRLLDLLKPQQCLDNWKLLLEAKKALLQPKEAEKLRKMVRSFAGEIAFSFDEFRDQIATDGSLIHKALALFYGLPAHAISHTQCASLVKKWISSLGWPQGFASSKRQKNVMTAICSIFDQMDHIDLITPKITLDDYLTQFQDRLLSHTISPSLGHNSLFLTTPETAIDLCSDSSWFLDCDVDYQGPSAPFYLPSQQNWKGLDWEAFLSHSLNLNTSHASGSQNLKAHPITKTMTVVTQTPAHVKTFKQSPFVSFSDFKVPYNTKSMGTGVFNNYSRCPFICFSENFLKCRPHTERDFEPSPLSLGSVIHLILERTWSKINPATGEQAKLLLQKGSLQALIQEQVRQTYAQRMRHRLALSCSESQLYSLILRWFRDFECTRSIPFTVLHTEHPLSLHLSGLALNLKCDRIDQVEGGGIVIIDYKLSAKAKSSGWLPRKRLDSAQLPLYHLSLSEKKPIQALVFAHVGFEKLGYDGYAASKPIAQGIGSGVKQLSRDLTWAQLEQSWAQRLEDMAKDLGEGIFTPSPKDVNQCNQCHYKTLCRIDQLKTV